MPVSRRTRRSIALGSCALHLRSRMTAGRARSRLTSRRVPAGPSPSGISGRPTPFALSLVLRRSRMVAGASPCPTDLGGTRGAFYVEASNFRAHSTSAASIFPICSRVGALVASATYRTPAWTRDSDAMIALQKAGRSSGLRDVIRLPSTTTSSSSQRAPALTMSSLMEE